MKPINNKEMINHCKLCGKILRDPNRNKYKLCSNCYKKGYS